MQDRYAGDIGDFIKLGLLRAVSRNRKLGISWYRFPDQSHNADGRHISYLNNPDLYAPLDPDLFTHLKAVVRHSTRSINALLPLLEDAVSADENADMATVPRQSRGAWRSAWFARSLQKLSGCDLVFADPDNGMTDDNEKRKAGPRFGKHIPLSEVLALASGRCAIIYHHNTRRPGGHDAEVEYWFDQIGLPGMAVRATAYSARTFFILNPDQRMINDVTAFCGRWQGAKVRLHDRR